MTNDEKDFYRRMLRNLEKRIAQRVIDEKEEKEMNFQKDLKLQIKVLAVAICIVFMIAIF